MQEHDTDDVRPHGGIDVATLQRYLNFHCSLSLDLFGAETSTNAANYFAAGLKGRFHEEQRDDDHRLVGATRTVPVATDDGIGEREAPALSALNETLREDYIADCQQGHRPMEPHPGRRGSTSSTLPHVGFNRAVGTFAGRTGEPRRPADQRRGVGVVGVVVAADRRRPGLRDVADGGGHRAGPDGRLGGAALDGHPRQAGRLRLRQDLTSSEGWGPHGHRVQRLRRPARPQRRARPGRPPGRRHARTARSHTPSCSARSRATAAGLRRLGVGPEQRVAMVMLDSIEFYDVFLAAMRIGAVPAPVNPLLPGRDLGADRRRQPRPRPGASRPSGPARSTRSAPRPPRSRPSS